MDVNILFTTFKQGITGADFNWIILNGFRQAIVEFNVNLKLVISSSRGRSRDKHVNGDRGGSVCRW